MIKKYSGSIPKDGVVLFSAPWCGPCKVMHPFIEKMQAEVIEVNVDEFPQLVSNYGVNGVPTLMRFVNGVPVATLSGGGHSPIRIQNFILGLN